MAVRVTFCLFVVSKSMLDSGLSMVIDASVEVNSEYIS